MANKKADKKADALATKECTDMAEYDYGDDAGEGFENQTQDDTVVPFLVVLQSKSKPCDELQEQYPDARPGMLFNTATEELMDVAHFVPAYTEHCFVEWKPDRGGFVAKHDIYSDLVKNCKATQDFGKYTTPDGNELVETFYVYGACYDDDGPTTAVVISFTSTKIKPYKSWNSKIKGFQLVLGKAPNIRKQCPPIYAHSVELSTVKQKHSQGTSFNFVLKPASGTIKESLLKPSDPRFEAGRQFKELVKSGERQADMSKQESAGGGDGTSGEKCEDF